MTKEQVKLEAMSLAPAEREALADELYLSLHDDDQAAINAAWLDEVRRRDADFRASGEKGSTVEEVIPRLLERVRK